MKNRLSELKAFGLRLRELWTRRPAEFSTKAASALGAIVADLEFDACSIAESLERHPEIAPRTPTSLLLFREGEFFVELSADIVGPVHIEESTWSGALAVVGGAALIRTFDWKQGGYPELCELQPPTSEWVDTAQTVPVRDGVAVQRLGLAPVVCTVAAGRTAMRGARRLLTCGVGFDPKPTARSNRWRHALALRRVAKQPTLYQFTHELLGSATPDEAVFLLRHLAEIIPHEELQIAADNTPARFEELARRLLREAREAKRLRGIQDAYQVAVGADTRSFLLLLMHGCGRHEALTLAARRVPESSPPATLVRWIRALRDAPSETGTSHNMIPLDEAASLVLETRLGTDDDEQAVVALRERFEIPDGDLSLLKELLDGLRESSILRGLLS